MEPNKLTKKINKNLKETFDENQWNKYNTIIKSKIYNKKYKKNI